MSCKWLFWDGSYRLNGDLNRAPGRLCPPPVAPLFLPERPARQRPLRLMVPCSVAVDILAVVERSAFVAVKLRLHNPHLIRALLFRVTLGPVPATGGVRPVYQEVLADGDVEGLTPAEETTNGGLLPFPREAGVPLADGQVDEAFHFQVWVSSGSGAFQSCPTATGKPELQFGRQVHDRFRPGEREIGRRLALVQGETRQLVIARKLRREATEKEAAVPNHTVRPYHLHLMAGAPLARVREILSEAAHAHLPFTEALVAVARPVEPTHAE